MKIRVNVSIAGAVLALVLAAATYYVIPYCVAEVPASADVGPRAFPQLICILVAIISVIQLVLVLMGKMPTKHQEISLETHGKTLLAMALALVAAILSSYISVVIAAMLCSLLYLALLRVKDCRGYAAVFVTGGLLYILMRFALHIRF